ncbi:MAG: Ig-like domain-containing protein, partial [Cyanobacteria bacterium J06642_11]
MNPGDTVLFSPDRDTVGVGNAEDILQSDGAGGFSLFFDGSSLGLSGANIDAFDLVSATEILMSFSRTVFLTGIGLVDDSDIVQFTATSLGENATTGSFSMVLDGSTIGLTRAGEDIDALTQMPDETLLFSTKSTANTTNGLQAENEDLMQYDPDNGNLSLYFDGSDVGLDERREDIDAISFVNNQLLLSTAGGFTVDGLSGQDEDIFSFTATATGINTQGSFDPTLCFDGSTLGFNGDIAALDIVAMLDAVDDTFSIAENTVLNGNLFADNGSGVDTGNSFTVTATSSTTNGALLVNADGTFSYTPGNNFVGSDSFMYSISDGTNTDIATVNITVTAGLNTAPNITSDGGGAIATINVAENTTAVTNVETNDDSDTEGSGLTYSFSTIGGGGADNGSFSLDANTGVLAFVTAPDFETPGSVDNDNQYLVQVTVTDSGNLTDTQDIAVNVTDVATENNAAPVVNNVTYNMLGNSILEIAG